jgi:plastocyanin
MTILKRRVGALLFSLVAAAVLLAAGCSSSNKSSSGSSTSAPSTLPVPSSSSTEATSSGNGASAAPTKVTIKDFAFGPKSVTVKVGQSVEFTNTDGVTHTATSTSGAFDTGDLDSGASKAVTFAHAGTFPYHCSIHNSMTGTVTVTN